MAGFREHVTFSSLLGLGYGCLAVFGAGYSPQQGALAGCLAGIGGMLPDLDLPTGKPGHEVFSLTAAIVPLFLVGRVQTVFNLPNDAETTVLCVVAMYVAIRYGLAWVVARFSSHRGMFHSIPALGIAAEVVFLSYPSKLTTVKLLMGGGVGIGFLSHLILDEIWSVKWNGVVPELKKSSGTAFKMVGDKFFPNALTFAMLATTSFLVLDEAGLINRPQTENLPIATESQKTATSPDAPLLREAALPEELQNMPATTLGTPNQHLETPDVRFNMNNELELGTPGRLPQPPNSFQPVPETRPVPAPRLEEVFSNPPQETLRGPAFSPVENPTGMNPGPLTPRALDPLVPQLIPGPGAGRQEL